MNTNVSHIAVQRSRIWMLLYSTLLFFPALGAHSQVFVYTNPSGPLSPPSTEVTYYATAQVQSDGLHGFNNYRSNFQRANAGSVVASDSGSFSDGGSVYQASFAEARTEFGLVGVKVSGSTAGFLDGVSGGSSEVSSALASFSDYLAIYSPSMRFGTPIFLTVDLNFDGHLTASAGGTFYVPFSIDGLLSTVTITESFAAQLFDVTQQIEPGANLLTAELFNGEVFNFQLLAGITGHSVVEDLHASGSGTAYYTGDFLNTLSWNGVVSAVDQFGNPILDLTLTGSDGTSYMQSFGDSTPVPESSAYGVGGSFALLACVALRRWKARRTDGSLPSVGKRS